jgi:aquaporin Z
MPRLFASTSRISTIVAGSSLAQGAECGHKLKAIDSLRLHWPDYLMEAGGLSIYMFSVCAFATLSWHPASPIRQFIDGAIPRRAVMGLGIGTALIAVVVSPWGRRSGGHLNPAMTLAFYRLGKLELWDMLFYAGSQFLGALAGVAVAAHVLRGALGNTAVHYAVTAPGVYGDIVAFVAEVMISFVLMSTILFVSEHEHLARYTPYFAGALVAICFVFEAPLSGNSANPARSFASAMFASYWHALWIYFTAPPFGMLAAAEAFLFFRAGVGPFCAKLHHANHQRCVFHHGYRTVFRFFG